MKYRVPHHISKLEYLPNFLLYNKYYNKYYTINNDNNIIDTV